MNLWMYNVYSRNGKCCSEELWCSVCIKSETERDPVKMTAFQCLTPAYVKHFKQNLVLLIWKKKKHIWKYEWLLKKTRGVQREFTKNVWYFCAKTCFLVIHHPIQFMQIQFQLTRVYLSTSGENLMFHRLFYPEIQ